MDAPLGNIEDAANAAVHGCDQSHRADRLLREPHRPLMEVRHQTQHLVIGSGAGGAVTAAYLAEAGESVLILEEGSAVRSGEVGQFSLEQMRRQYRKSGMTAMFGNYLVNYAEGCCLGGSSEINSGLYHLPDERLLGEWRHSHKVKDLSVASINHYARDIEETLAIALPESGPTDGASLRLLEGAKRLRWQCQEVPRWAHRDDAGHTIWHGMSSTFIPRAEKAGANLMTDAKVERITIRNRRAVGVIAQGSDGAPFFIGAERVWVCCGSIGTASLLKRSGCSLRGGGLSAHPTVKSTARFSESLGPALDVPTHQIKEFAPDITIGGSSRTASQIALALSEDWPDGSGYLAEPENVGIFYAAVRPKNQPGSVINLPGVSDPVPLLWISKRDRMLLSSGLRRTCHLLLSAGAKEVRTGIPGLGPLRTAEDTAKLPRILPLSANLMTVHTFSTVPMGEKADLCPADSFGTLREASGIQVNDASLIPSAPGINPQGTVMALAARNVDHYLASR